MSNWQCGPCIPLMSWMLRKSTRLSLVLAATLLSAINGFLLIFGASFLGTNGGRYLDWVAFYLPASLCVIALVSFWHPRAGFGTFTAFLAASVLALAAHSNTYTASHIWEICEGGFKFALLGEALLFANLVLARKSA